MLQSHNLTDDLIAGVIFDVSLQVLLADLVVGGNMATIEHRRERFHTCGVNQTLYVLTYRILYRFIIKFNQCEVSSSVIRIDRDSRFG